MSYAQVSDFINRYPLRDLIQLTNEDPTQTTVNTIYLQTFLNDASYEIDTYLESRFALPLTDPPSILVSFNCKIAMYHLQALRPIHDLKYAEDQYKYVIKQLEAVSNLSRTLGLAGDAKEPADPSSPAIVFVEAGGDPTGRLPMRVFRRGTLIGF